RTTGSSSADGAGRWPCGRPIRRPLPGRWKSGSVRCGRRSVQRCRNWPSRPGPRYPPAPPARPPNAVACAGWTGRVPLEAPCHGLGRRELTPPPFSYARVDLAAGPEAIAGVVPWQPDAVIHAAARAAPWGRRADYEHDNVAATRAIVDYCRAAGRPRLVYVS